MDPLPYNITIPAQSPAIAYVPSHDLDSTLEDGWNVTYSNGTAFTLYGAQGVGDSSLLTTSLVSIELAWIGTAAYLYGNTTTSKLYQIFIDDGDAIAQTYPGNNLLAAVTDLPYGSHAITLNHEDRSDVLAFHYAVLTIGVGYKGSSFQVQNRSVPAVLDGKANNAFFEFRKVTSFTPWILSPPSLEEFLPNGTSQPTPRAMTGQLSSTSDPGLVFKVTNSSAFFIRGFVGTDGGPKLATLIPGLNEESSKTTLFNDFSPLWDFDQVLYWESGLDRDQTYTVQMYASNGSRSDAMLFHTLDIIDGGSNPSEISSSAATGPTRAPGPSRQVKRLPTGSIAGITVGAILAVILAILVLCWLRRRKRAQALEIADASKITPFIVTKHRRGDLGPGSKHNPIHEPETLPSPSSNSNPDPDPPLGVSASVTRGALRHLRRFRSFASRAPIRETDAGPATLPPEYDHSWASNANSPTPVSVPVPASPRRALPIPPGPGPSIPVDKVKSRDLEQTANLSPNRR